MIRMTQNKITFLCILAKMLICVPMCSMAQSSGDELREIVAQENRVFALSPDGHLTLHEYHLGRSSLVLAEHTDRNEVFALYAMDERGRFEANWVSATTVILSFLPMGHASCSPRVTLLVDTDKARSGFRSYVQTRASDSSAGRVQLSQNERVNRLIPHMLRSWSDIEQFDWPGVNRRTELPFDDPACSSQAQPELGPEIDSGAVTSTLPTGQDQEGSESLLVGQTQSDLWLAMRPLESGEQALWMMDPENPDAASVYFADPPFDLTDVGHQGDTQRILSIRYFAHEPREVFLDGEVRQLVSRVTRAADGQAKWLAVDQSLNSALIETAEGFWLSRTDQQSPLMIETKQPWRGQRKAITLQEISNGRRGLSLLRPEVTRGVLLWTDPTQHLDLALARGLASQGIAVAWAAPYSIADKEMLTAAVTWLTEQFPRIPVCLWFEGRSGNAQINEQACAVVQIHHRSDWQAVGARTGRIIPLVRAWAASDVDHNTHPPIGPFASHPGRESDEQRSELVRQLADQLGSLAVPK